MFGAQPPTPTASLAANKCSGLKVPGYRPLFGRLRESLVRMVVYRETRGPSTSFGCASLRSGRQIMMGDFENPRSYERLCGCNNRSPAEGN
jgi:hypothetical protein